MPNDRRSDSDNYRNRFPLRRSYPGDRWATSTEQLIALCPITLGSRKGLMAQLEQIRNLPEFTGTNKLSYPA